MNSYSQDLRERAVNLYLTGNYNKKSLSYLLSVGYKALRSWIKLYETTGSCEFTPPLNVGRKRLFDDKDVILAYLKLNPDADGKELRNALAPHVAQSCFYNTLNRLGITYKKRGKIQKTLRS
jgi:transposase